MHEQKKTIGQREYTVYGANADLINWATSSRIAAQALGSAKVKEDELFCAFGSSTDAERVDYSMKVIEKLWYSQPVLGPYPFLKTLSKFEFDRVFYPNYRDHVCHQLKVYLLGLLAYESCPRIRDEMEHSFDIPGVEAEREFLLRWLIAAVYHDVGYVLENDDALQVSGTSWQVTRDAINHVLAAPLSTMPMFRRFIPRSVELKLIQEHQIFTPEIRYPGDIERHNKIDLLDQLNAEALRAGLAAEGSPLRAYYEYAFAHDALDPTAPSGRGRGRYHDHGIASAMLLLRTWRVFNDYVGNLSVKAGKDPLIQEHFSKLDDLSKDLAAHSESIRAAAAAIALHNINGKNWDHGEALSHGLTFHRFKICLSEQGQQTPLAFLLGLIDSLQDWDRPRFRPIRTNDKPILIDQDISITSAAGRLLVHLPADADSFKNPSATPESGFSKAKAAMKEYLQEDEIDALVAWTDTPQSVPVVSTAAKVATVQPDGAEVTEAKAVLDSLPRAYQSYGKLNLFEAGRALLVDAKERVVLMAKTPIPIVGTRPYDGSSVPLYYEREQYDAYSNVIKKASVDHNLHFLCVTSVPSLEDDIAKIAAGRQTAFRQRIAENLRQIDQAQKRSGSKCIFRWTAEPTPTTFLVVDDNFIIWLKNEKGESVCLGAQSRLLADALAHRAATLSFSMSDDELLSFIKKIQGENSDE